MGSALVAEWVAAIGTIGAFTVTIGLLWKELREAARRRDDDRRAQARQVSVWPGAVAYNRWDDAPRRFEYFVSLGVRNGSDEPAYDVWIFVNTPTVEWVPEFRRSLELGLLPPGYRSESHRVIMGNADYRQSEPPHIRTTEVRLELFFRDAAGRLWRRFPNGRLAQAKAAALEQAQRAHQARSPQAD